MICSGQTENAYRILTGEPEQKRLLEIFSGKQDNNRYAPHNDVSVNDGPHT
jgi:hypothetical protein